MAKTVSVTIDGRKVKVPEGTTILDAAEQAGVHIPNLCYLKGMRGIGACRLCFVEIEGMKAPMTACTTRVKDGMNITTSSEQINELRRYVIDLILSMHPNDCMTCPKTGVCELQKYAYEYEVKDSSFTRKEFGFGVDDKNPFIRRSPDYCILCLRCVRVCKEQDTGVLDVQGRGVGSKITTANDRPLQEAGCTFCGSCVDVCPVYAIAEADLGTKGREWQFITRSSVCLSCGAACETSVSTNEVLVGKVRSGGDRGSATHYLCAIGRFGHDAVNADKRIQSPMKKDGSDFKSITWKAALEEMASNLKKGAGVLVSGNLTCEDYLTLKDFSEKAGLKVASTVEIYGDAPSLVGPEADIDGADLIVVAGLKASQWTRTLAAVDAAVRRMSKRAAKLIVVSSEDTGLEEKAAVSLKADPIEALKAIVEGGNSEEETKARELFESSQSPLVITTPVYYEALTGVLKKGTVVSVPVEANAKGAMMMGLPTGALKDIEDGKVKVLYVVGETHLKARPSGVDYLIVQTTHMNELASEADLVLPLTTGFEVDGTVVDWQGRVKALQQCVEPFVESRNLRDSLVALSKAMGLQVKAAKATDVKKAIKAFKVSPEATGPRTDLNYNPEELIPVLNRSIISNSRLEWLQTVKAERLG
jgi:NADH dehydrogenase/NADH:ubiquinone oxidoreductase subunit G